MRIATYEYQGSWHCGLVDGDRLLPFPDGTDLAGLLRAGLSQLPATGVPVPLSAVRLLPPLEPPAVRDFVTFEEYVEGIRRHVDRAAAGGSRRPGMTRPPSTSPTLTR